MENKKTATPPRPSKKQRLEILLSKFNQWVSEGISPQDAVEKFTTQQYDFLIDNDINFDSLVLTDSQKMALQEVKRAPRPTFTNGYNKRYPKTKIELYQKIQEFLVKNGAAVNSREKENFRDIDFCLEGKNYKIVLSEPRQKKE